MPWRSGNTRAPPALAATATVRPMEQTRDRILELIDSAPDLEYAARYAVEELATLATYSWVGIYWVDGDELVLGAWTGPEATEHTRIKIGEGVCGAAAASGRTEIVADVDEDERYLQCFHDTRSEIVVPIVREGKVIGEIDVDATEIAAFDQSDANILEGIAAALAERAVDGPPLGGESDDEDDDGPTVYTA